MRLKLAVWDQLYREHFCRSNASNNQLEKGQGQSYFKPFAFLLLNISPFMVYD